MNKIIYLTAALAMIAPLAVKAERLQIVNENKKELKVKVRANGDPLTERLAEKRVDIPAEHYYELYVSSSDLKGKSLYSIEGDTNPFTPGGSCQNMSVNKKYKVIFKNDTVGTSCVATELPS